MPRTVLDKLVSINTHEDRERVKKVFVHLVHCRTGPGRDYERDNERIGLTTNAKHLMASYPTRLIRS